MNDKRELKMMGIQKINLLDQNIDIIQKHKNSLLITIDYTRFKAQIRVYIAI